MPSLKDRERLISEGFPTELATKMEERMRAAQGSGPLMNAGVPQHEPVLSMVQRLASFGVMKAALPH